MSEEQFPPQHQEKQPGLREDMAPKPVSGEDTYRGCGRLEGKSAIITGGDSGIGRATAIAFAREGADVAIVYLDEHDDARDTARLVEKAGRRALVLPGDVGDEDFCRRTVEEAVKAFGHLDVLVNVAGVQYPQKSILDISRDQLEKTFRTNIFSFFYMIKAALPHLKEGSAIINTLR